MNCVLYGGTKLDWQATVRRSDLVRPYRRTFKMDVASLIGADLSVFRCRDYDLIFFDPQATGDELFYNQLQKRERYYQGDKLEFTWARSKIPARVSVLEVGAGSGAWMVSEVLRQHWFGACALVDLRFFARLKNAAVRRIVRLLRLDTIDQRFLGNGHTVKVAYAKL